MALVSVVQLTGARSCIPRGHEFDPLAGHIPRGWVQPPVGVCTGGNWLMSLSPMDVSFSLSLPSLLSKTNKHVLGWGLKKNNKWNNKEDITSISIKTYLRVNLTKSVYNLYEANFNTFWKATQKPEHTLTHMKTRCDLAVALRTTGNKWSGTMGSPYRKNRKWVWPYTIRINVSEKWKTLMWKIKLKS